MSSLDPAPDELPLDVARSGLSSIALKKGPPVVVEFNVSSFCNRGDCVEVGMTPEGIVHVRDSKDELHTTLTFDRDEWVAFIKGVKLGEFDLG